MPHPESRSGYRISTAEGRLSLFAAACCVLYLVCASWALISLLSRDQTPEHGDQGAYLELAVNIAEGRGFVSDNLSAFQPKPDVTHRETNRQPLYPYLLSSVAGRDVGFLWRAKCLTAIIAVLLLIVVLVCVSLRFGLAAGLVATVLLGIHGTFMTLATEVWCENVLVLFLVLTWFLLARSQQDGSPKRSWQWAAGAGTALGLAYLTKSSAVMVVPSLAVALLLSRPKTDLGDADGLSTERKRCIFLNRFGAFLVFSLVASVAVLPHLYRTWRATGSPFYSPEISGMMWIDFGPRDAWRVYDTLPTMSSYFERHTVQEASVKWFRGLRLVLRRFLELARDHPGRLPVGWLMLPLALLGLWREQRVIRGMILVFALLNVASFAWYAHVDVAPRFVYPLTVFYFIYAGAGTSAAVERFFPRKIRRASVAYCVVIGALMLWSLPGLWTHANWRSKGGESKTLRAEEAETLRAIATIVQLDEVLCMGPSHELAYYWVINRKRVFVPTYTELDEFRKHLDRFNVRYFLLDTSVIRRNMPLLGRHFAADPFVGILQKEGIPWLEKVYENRGSPLRFILFRVREKEG